MINDKKYASDKFINPLIIVLFIITTIFYGVYDSKIPALITAISFVTILLGVQIYRNYKENNKKLAACYLIGLLAMYLFVIIYN
ncbi:hypothetical protein IM793_03605 [Pedobacter sp. MR2016-19]|uniref:hypothetical protein n=1 Tax=Pedobacter sp. MR2016-19 TaxID=2780089 RepID=UPI0018747F38|nr:hypothetical protein [Pedobacter sp. MR2016-19]MBE5318233.1 hypothetical protein [Pedobacter sp. MR2016-19]